MGFLLAFAIVLPPALIVISTHNAVENVPQRLFAFANRAENHPILTTASLTAITSNDVNRLRFAPEDINAMYITAGHGRVTIGLHDEDFISVHSTQSSTYTHDEEDGILRMNSSFGNFSILFPNNLETAIENLTVVNQFNHTNIGASDLETIIIGNLYVNSSHGRINMTNLVVVEVLDVSTSFGTINIVDVFSNQDTTSLRTGDFGRLIAN